MAGPPENANRGLSAPTSGSAFDPSTAGFSPNRSLYWPGQNQEPMPGQDPAQPPVPHNPRPQDVEYALFQAQEVEQQQAQQAQARQQQQQVEQEVNRAGGEWVNQHARLLKAGGLVGYESVVDEGLRRGDETFASYGVQYRMLPELQEEIQAAAARDVRDFAEMAQLKPEAFEQVGDLGGLPVIRLSPALLEEGKENGPFIEYTLPQTKGKFFGLVSQKPVYRVVNPEYREAYSAFRHSTTYGYKRGKSPETNRWREVLAETGFDPGDGGTAADLSYWEMFRLGGEDLQEDEYGFLPARAGGIGRGRTTPLWQGEPEEKATEGKGSALYEFEHAAADTAQLGLGGLLERHMFPEQRRAERAKALIPAKGEGTGRAAGTALGFVAGLPAGFFKAGGRLIGKPLGKAGAKAMTRKAAKEGGELYAETLWRYKATNFLGNAAGRVTGGLVYDKFRPTSEVEHMFVEDATAAYERDGMSPEMAMEQAESDLASENLKGGLLMFSLVELSGGVLPPIFKKVAKYARTGGPMMAAGKVSAGKAKYELYRGRAWEQRFDQVFTGAASGAAQGTLLAGIDPATRQAFKVWWESDFEDEKAWEQLKEGWLASGTVFALHGGMTTLIGGHKALLARAKELEPRVSPEVLKQVKANTKNLTAQLYELEGAARKRLAAEVKVVEALGRGQRAEGRELTPEQEARRAKQEADRVARETRRARKAERPRRGEAHEPEGEIPARKRDLARKAFREQQEQKARQEEVELIGELSAEIEARSRAKGEARRTAREMVEKGIAEVELAESEREVLAAQDYLERLGVQDAASAAEEARLAIEARAQQIRSAAGQVRGEGLRSQATGPRGRRRTAALMEVGELEFQEARELVDMEGREAREILERIGDKYGVTPEEIVDWITAPKPLQERARKLSAERVLGEVGEAWGVNPETIQVRLKAIDLPKPAEPAKPAAEPKKAPAPPTEGEAPAGKSTSDLPTGRRTRPQPERVYQLSEEITAREKAGKSTADATNKLRQHLDRFRVGDVLQLLDGPKFKVLGRAGISGLEVITEKGDQSILTASELRHTTFLGKASSPWSKGQRVEIKASGVVGKVQEVRPDGSVVVEHEGGTDIVKPGELQRPVPEFKPAAKPAGGPQKDTEGEIVSDRAKKSAPGVRTEKEKVPGTGGEGQAEPKAARREKAKQAKKLPKAKAGAAAEEIQEGFEAVAKPFKATRKSFVGELWSEEGERTFIGFIHKVGEGEYRVYQKDGHTGTVIAQLPETLKWKEIKSTRQIDLGYAIVHEYQRVREAPKKGGTKATTGAVEVRPGVVVETRDVSPEELRVEGERFQQERQDIGDKENQVDPKRPFFKQPWDAGAYAANPILAVENADGTLTVVAGHHRRARALGLHGSPDRAPGKIPVRVITAKEGAREAAEEYAREQSVATNVSTKQLSNLELVETVSGWDKDGLSQKEIAEKLGMSQARVRKILDLAFLPKSMLDFANDLGSGGDSKVSRMGQSLRQNPQLWTPASIQRHLVKNLREIGDLSYSGFDQYMRQIERTFQQLKTRQDQGVLPGMEKKTSALAAEAVETGRKRGDLVGKLEGEKKRLETLLKAYGSSEAAEDMQLVRAAKEKVESLEKKIKVFDIEHDLADQGTLFGAPETKSVLPVEAEGQGGLFDAPAISKRGVEVVERELTGKDLVAYERELDAGISRVGDVEVAGFFGVDSGGERKSALLGEGTFKAVGVAKFSRDLLLDRAADSGIVEIQGIFHTHPKGYGISEADISAAERVSREVGTKLYVYEGGSLREVPGAGRATELAASKAGTMGEALNYAKEVMVGAEIALEEQRKALSEGKVSSAMPGLERAAREAKVNYQLLENAAGKADKENPFRQMDEIVDAGGEAAAQDLFLEAGKPEGIGFAGFLKHLWNPAADKQMAGYQRHSTHTPWGLWRLFEMPMYIVIPKVYDAMRTSVVEMRKRLDLYHRKLFGRSFVDQLRYGGKGAQAGVFKGIKADSKEDALLHGAGNGLTVGDWNSTGHLVEKYGKLNQAPGTDLRDVLSPDLRRRYDSMDPFMRQYRERIWKHIQRGQIAGLQKRISQVDRELGVWQGRLSQYEAIESDFSRQGHQARAEKRMAELEAERGRRQERLDTINEGVDPDTGRSWGFDRYIHRLWEPANRSEGQGWDQLPPQLQKEIPREKWVGFLQQRKGRPGFVWSAIRSFEVYIPAAEAKMAQDLMLDTVHREMYGEQRRARGLKDLLMPWHRQHQKATDDMAVVHLGEDGERRRFMVLPGTMQKNQEGNPVSVRIVDRGNMESTYTVFRDRGAAREAGQEGGLVARDFLVRDGGIAQTLSNPEEAARKLDYMEKWVKRSLGKHPKYGKLTTVMQKATMLLTKLEYHAYIGAMYPKAAVTNLVFGSQQLFAEVGLPDGYRGLKLATDILLRGRGNSTRETRHYYKVLREAAPHLESLIGFTSAGERGIANPSALTAKAGKHLSAISFGPFRASEALIRAGSFLAGYQKAVKAGYSHEASMKYGRELVARTQFDMGAYAAPEITEQWYGFPLIMLRRFAYNYARRHARGYNAGYKMLKGQFASMTGLTPVQLFKAEWRNMTPEAKAVARKAIKEGQSPEHLNNAAYVARSAVLASVITGLWRTVFGRDPRFQMMGSPSDIPILRGMNWMDDLSPVTKAIYRVPIPGLTGPFDAMPVQAQVVASGMGALMDRMRGNPFAMSEWADKNRPAWMSRTGANLYNIFTAQALNDEGDVTISRGGQINYTTTMENLVLNMIVPGQPVETKAQWDASDAAYAASQVHGNTRRAASRMIMGGDKEEILRGLKLAQANGILLDFDSLERRKIFLKAPASVRQLFSSFDKSDQVKKAAALIPHYTDYEFKYAAEILGMTEQEWYLYPDGTPKISADAFRALIAAVKERNRDRD